MAIKNLLKLLRNLPATWRFQAVGLAIGAAVTSLNLVDPWLLKYAIDRVLPSRSTELVIEFVLFWLAVATMQALGEVCARYAYGLAGERVAAELRQALGRSYLRKPLAFFRDSRHGELMAPYTVETGVIQSMVEGGG